MPAPDSRMVPLSPRSPSRPAAAALAVVLTALVPVTAGAQPSAEWSQFQGGPAHPGQTPAAEGPAPPYRVRWALPAPDGASLSGAVIAGAVAVTVGREALYGVDLASGGIVWEVGRDGGPLSVPAVGQARGRGVLLYLEGPPAETAPPSPTDPPSPTPSPGSERQEDGGSWLVALDLESRDELWRAELGAVARSGVTVVGGTAYVSDQAGVVHAVGLDDGDADWTAEVGGRADLPLAIGDGRVYAVSRDPDERRVAITALAVEDGERLWQVSPQIGATAVSAPASVEGGVVVGTADRLVRMLDAEDGEERWRALALSLFSPVSSPATGGGEVLAADIGGGVYRLDPRDGSRRWGFQFNELILRSSPVRSGGVVLVGLNDGRLGALGLGTGRLVWRGGPVPGLVGTIAVSEDVVVAVKGGPQAGLIAFEHDPDGSLVDAPSPTVLAPGTTLARASLAALAVFVVAYGLSLLGRRRFGDAFAPGGTDEPGEEEA